MLRTLRARAMLKTVVLLEALRAVSTVHGIPLMHIASTPLATSGSLLSALPLALRAPTAGLLALTFSVAARSA